MSAASAHLLAAGAALAIAFSFAYKGETTAGAHHQQINPADFQATITHRLFPVSATGPKVFVGREKDPDTGRTLETRLESRLLPKTEVVAGVTVVLLEEKAYEDDELVEVAIDYFAQHRDGSVYYFGEVVDNYEDGRLKDHAGQWIAGEGGNEPGVIMPAQPAVGQSYSQESAPGVAEDKATVLAVNETVKVPAGTYQGCLKTRDFTPLEPGVEELKWYCPGVGLVKEQGDDSVNELVSVGPPPAPTAPGGALTAAQDSVAAPIPPPVEIAAPRTGDAGLADAVDDAWVLVAIGAAVAITSLTTLKLTADRRSRGL